MGGVTHWVRQALAELGPDASAKQVTDYILAINPSIPRSHISLAMRNLKIKRLSAAGERSETRQPLVNPLQGTLDFSE